MDQDDQIDSVGLPLWPAIVAFFVVVIIWLLNLLALLFWVKNWSSYGDMFGPANAAFSGFAFAGVAYAIYIQRQEIKIARTEIAYTKRIMSKQQEQLTLQNEETKKQIFESTFFQLLRLLTDLTTGMDIQRVDRITKGKDVFPVFLKKLRTEYVRDGAVLYDREIFQGAYERFYRQNNSELGHYFRTVYNIVKFVDKSKIGEKKFYTNILRAQLSDAEVALLFHNGLSPYGSEKFKPLMERYGLLKNVTDQDLLDVSLKKEYATSVFG